MPAPYEAGIRYLHRRVLSCLGPRLGSVEDVLLDAHAQTPQWLVIRLPGPVRRRRAVPLLLATEGRGGLVLPLTKETLRRSPRVPWRTHLTADQELALRRYWMDL